MIRFEDWTGARPWALATMQAWHDATGAARERAAAGPLLPDDALFECLQAKRPFCFLRSLDTVTRVALRDGWEFRANAVRQYRKVRDMLP